MNGHTPAAAASQSTTANAAAAAEKKTTATAGAVNMLRKLFGRPDVKETVKKSKTDIRKGVRGECFWTP